MLPSEITPTTAHRFLDVPEWLEPNRRYAGTLDDLEGDVDHWQDGDGYLGPKPTKGTDARDVYMEALKKVFITEDIVSEVVKRRRKGVAGQAPTIDVAPLGEEDRPAEGEGEEGDEESEEASRSAQIASLLREWWRDRDMTDVLGAAAKRTTTEQQAVLRIIIDIRRLSEEGELGAATATTIDDALSAIDIEVIPRSRAFVHEDPRSKRRTGFIEFEGTRGGRYEEEQRYIEKTFVGEDGETVLKVEDQGDLEDEQESFGLGGRLLHLQLEEEELFLSESLRSNQGALNTTRTLVNITGQKAGFPELHLVNIQAPEDEDGNPEPTERGPGKIQYHVSVPKKAQGPRGETEERQGTADVVETEPVDNESLRKDAVVARESVYRSAHQLHVFMGKDSTASGRSRVEARADHVKDLEDLADVLGRAGEWMLETSWHLAHELAGEEAADISVDFDCQVDPGPLTPEMKREVREAFRDDVISLRTAQLMYGVEDPEEEIERIRQEQLDEATVQQAGLEQFTEQVMQRRRELEDAGGDVTNRDSNRSNETDEQ